MPESPGRNARVPDGDPTDDSANDSDARAVRRAGRAARGASCQGVVFVLCGPQEPEEPEECEPSVWMHVLAV